MNAHAEAIERGGAGSSHRRNLQLIASLLGAEVVWLVETAQPGQLPGPLVVWVGIALALVHAGFDVLAAVLRVLSSRGIVTFVVTDSGAVRPTAGQGLQDDAAEAEVRKRLARDLHDAVKQQLFRIRLALATIQARWSDDPAGARAALHDAERGAAEAILEMDALLRRLSPAPLARIGLVEALREQAEALGYRTGIVVDVAFGTLPSEDRLPAGAAEALFRIGQEALSNIARHARAKRVWVRLHVDRDEAIVLDVEDDGRGIEAGAAADGTGLAGIRERAEGLGGVVAVQERQGGGTAVRVAVPLVDPDAVLVDDPAQELADTLVGRATVAGWVATWASVMVGLVAITIVADGGPRAAPMNEIGWLVFLAMSLSMVALSIGVDRRAVKRALEVSPAPLETEARLAAVRGSAWVMGSWAVIASLTLPWATPATAWIERLPTRGYAAAGIACLVAMAFGWWRFETMMAREAEALREDLRRRSPRQAWARHRKRLGQPPVAWLPFVALLPIAAIRFVVSFDMVSSLFSNHPDVAFGAIDRQVLLMDAGIAVMVVAQLARLIRTRRRNSRLTDELRARLDEASA